MSDFEWKRPDSKEKQPGTEPEEDSSFPRDFLESVGRSLKEENFPRTEEQHTSWWQSGAPKNTEESSVRQNPSSSSFEEKEEKPVHWEHFDQTELRQPVTPAEQSASFSAPKEQEPSIRPDPVHQAEPERQATPFEQSVSLSEPEQPGPSGPEPPQEPQSIPPEQPPEIPEAQEQNQTPPAYPSQTPPYGYPPYPQGRQSFGVPPQRTYAPYGQAPYSEPPQPDFSPKPPKNRGYRLFVGSLAVLGAVFVLGFFSFGVYSALAPAPETPSVSEPGPDEGPSESSPESSVPPIDAADDAVKAPSGAAVDPKFTGVVITPLPTEIERSAGEIYNQVSPSIVGVVCLTEQGQNSGSGIICRADGYIITNSHVINDTKNNLQVHVILHDNKKYNAVVVGFDKTTDLAVLKIDASGLPVAVFGDSNVIAVGDWVLAIGNPGGMTFASSLTRGVVSGLNRSVGYSDAGNMTYIQTDTAISPGASGGALLNMHGQVIGVNTSKLVAEGYEGMGFSIPISKAKNIVDDLILRGYVSGRARLGIGANQVSDLQMQVQGWPRGVIIVRVDEDSSFQGTKVKANDIITKVEGTEISTMAELYQKLGLHKAGDSLKMTIYRPGSLGKQGETFEVNVKLLADTGETQQTIQK